MACTQTESLLRHTVLSMTDGLSADSDTPYHIPGNLHMKL